MIEARTMMTPAEMQEMAEQKRGSQLYSKTTDGAEKVQEIVSRLTQDLANLPKKKADLRDAELISDIAIAYTDACMKSGTLPSKIGLCRALGYSRQSVDFFLKHHEEEPSAELLRIFFDSFAEALNSASLSNAVNLVTSIFISKAIYGYRDTVSIETELKTDPFITHRRTAADILRNLEAEGLGLPD